MRYHNITKADMLNGEGLRVVLWLAGCSHHCQACQNPITWNPNDGLVFDENAKKEVFDELEKDWCSGITFSGGDPLYLGNREGVSSLISEIRSKFPDKNIWCYTGYDFETDIKEKMMVKWPETREIIRYIDILVDGEFIEDKKDLTLRFRGSSNQRIIDVPESLNKGEVVLWNQEGRITQ